MLDKLTFNNFVIKELVLQLVYKYFYKMLFEASTYKQTLFLTYATNFLNQIFQYLHLLQL